MVDARARSSAPPTSGPACPGCGKAIDPLRAGQVAILDGAFRYFHDGACKRSYVETASKRPSLEALTVEPPGVGSGVRATAEPPAVSVAIVASGTASRESAAASVAAEAEAPAALVATPTSPFAPVPTPEPAMSSPAAPASGSGPDVTASEDVPPRTLRSPASGEEDRVEPARAARPEPAVPQRPRGSVLARARALSPSVGIASGLLAAAVVLGGDAALSARLPLALASAVIAVGLAVAPGREPAAPSRAVAVAPIVCAAVATVAARSFAPSRADAFAVFLGLAAAAELVADLLAARARRDVAWARAKIAKALSVNARVVRGDLVEEVDPSGVRPGEQLVVDAGEVVAADGVVVAGTAEVTPWPDAPVVMDKREGDAVVAGATVVSGQLRVEVTFTGAERAWLRLHAPSARVEVAAPVIALGRRLVNRGAAGAAAVVAAAVYASNGSWSDVALAACAGGTLVAARAALGASALAHARGHVAAQRRGIVYKDALAFDTAARADVAVVCSRGTVLLGEPELVAIEAVGPEGASALGADAPRVLSLAAGAEVGSTHPFAAAVLRAARARGVTPESVRSAIGHSGLGVTALVASGDRVVVGSRAFLVQEKISVAVADARISALEAQGRSVLLVAVAEKLVGLLALQDGLRPGARAAVQRMHDAYIEPVLLSGEARDTCETIARSLDIEHVRPEVLPAERGPEVRALADGGHVVAVIGHPASDDGALGAADVAVAMTAAGAAPGEWSVALASDDVRDAALALAIPRACRDRGRMVLAVGAGAQALGALGVGFGVVAPAVVPVVGAAVAAVALAMVRDATSLTPRR